VGLHPLLHVVAEQGGDVEQDHQRTGDREGQHRCLRGAGLDDGDRFVCGTKWNGMDVQSALRDQMHFSTLTFGKVRAGIRLEELALLIAKVQDQNLLRDVHIVLALGLIAGTNGMKQRVISCRCILLSADF